MSLRLLGRQKAEKDGSEALAFGSDFVGILEKSGRKGLRTVELPVFRKVVHLR